MSSKPSEPRPDKTGSGSSNSGGDGKPHSSSNTRSGQRGRRNNRRSNNTPTTQPHFAGKCDELKGHIYDCSDSRQHDLYVKTTKEIAEHVGRTYKYGGDISLTLSELKEPTMEEPTHPGNSASETRKAIWTEKVKRYVDRELYLKENIKSAYALIMGQCTEIMKSQLEGLDSYEDLRTTMDAIGLLKAIKQICFNFQSQKFSAQAIHEAQRKFYLLYQDPYTSCYTYLERFKNAVEVIDHVGGSIGKSPTILRLAIDESNVDWANATEDQKKTLRNDAKEIYLATAFIMGSDRKRYGKMINGLENQFLQGNDNYPRTLTSAYHMLVHWKQPHKTFESNRSTSTEGVAFTNVSNDGDNDGSTEQENGGTALATTKGSKTPEGKPDNSSVVCFKCQEKGHYANECPNDKKDDSAGSSKKKDGISQLIYGGMDDDDVFDDKFLFHTQVGTIGDSVLNNATKSQIPKTWILLDNQSNLDIFANPDMLENIRTVNQVMRVNSHGGVSTTNQQGDVPGYGTVWFDPSGIANILSLSNVAKRFKITFDSSNGNTFRVHKDDGSNRDFNLSPLGLYFLDTTMDGKHALVTTVDDKKNKYTRRQVEAAKAARKAQDIIGRPNTRRFMHMVQHNLIRNCPVTVEDVRRAEDIFGPNLGSLVGKTTRRPAEHVPTDRPIQVPIDIIQTHGQVTIALDVMKVNNVPFLVTISRHIKFGTAEVLPNQLDTTLMVFITRVVRIYYRRGFRVKYILGDGQFESLRAAIATELDAQLNICAQDEHVPEAERYIRTIKERTRCTYNMLPFRSFPYIMLIRMIHHSVFWLNMIPAADGVSDTISPRAIVIGTTLDFAKHCRLEFGAYAQVHEKHDNTMVPRTVGAICMGPTGNVQGSHFFLSLVSGSQIVRRNWQELPMPGEVIQRIENLARRNRADRRITFTRRDGTPIEDLDEPAGVDDDDDTSYNPDSDSDANSDQSDELTNSDTDSDAETNNSDNLSDTENEEQPNPGIIEPEQPNPGIIEPEPRAIPVQYGPPQDEQPGEIPGVREQPAEIPGVNEPDDDPVGIPADGNQPTAGDAQANTIPRRGERVRRAPERLIETHMMNIWGESVTNRFHNNLVTRIQGAIRPADNDGRLSELLAVALTQYHAQKGLKIFGERGAEAISSELKQVDTMEVLDPKSNLTEEEKLAALKYLMFLKEKRCGTIKGRGCADGRPQRETKSKEDSSSPTVAIEALFLSCLIDAIEERDVGTCDIPGAFMHADMDEIVHVKFEGVMAEALAKINPALYRKHVLVENGKKVLYAELRKALYGTLRAALLFWKELVGTLEEYGFELNPYDSCVANKTIRGSQCTVVWHVDDLKISHVDPDVVTTLIEMLNQKYGQHKPLTVTRGKKHEYLGMAIDFSKKGKVIFDMTDYIEKMLQDLPSEMEGESPTPAANYLFETNDKCPKLPEKEADLFHHLTAKLLYLGKRARPDIQTPIAFLSTRVRNPDKDDYKKLIRVIRYLRATIHLKLTLDASDPVIIKWFVDGSFAPHPDMKSHTGGMMTMGGGAAYATSIKQKINTRSSTEAELVAVNDVLGQILWTQQFLRAQGFDIPKASKLYQDNKSAMLLEKNGRSSSSKRTRHINIRYYFVQDRISKGEIDLEHCPTEDMIADFYTKPLQGSTFIKFRNAILNIED